MANPPIGLDFLEGCLGVCKITFNSIDMGKSMGGCEIEFVEDIKDILHDQDGTQPYDKVPTGQAWLVRTPLSEITAIRLQQITRGVTIAGAGSVSFGKNMFISGRENFAKKLVLKRVDSTGVVSADPMFILNFYKAMPRITAPLTYTVDGQRVMSVEWYIFEDETNKMFGYLGYNSSLGLTA